MSRKHLVRISMLLFFCLGVGYGAMSIRARWLHQQSPAYHWEQAQAALTHHQHDVAEIHLRRLLAIDPTHHRSRLALVGLYEERADGNKADARVIEHLRIALEYRPNDIALMERLVRMHWDLRETDQATALAQIAYERGSRSPVVIQLAAIKAVHHADYDQAAQLLDDLRLRVPEWTLDRVLLDVQIARQRGENDRADQAICRTFRSLAKLDPPAISILAKADGAILQQFLTAALDEATEEVDARQRLWAALEIISVLTRGQKSLQRSIEIGNCTAALFGSLECRFPIGSQSSAEALRYRKLAIEQFERLANRVVQSDGASPILYYWRAKLAIEQQQDDEALTFLERGLAAGKNLPADQSNDLSLLHLLVADRLLVHGELTLAEQHIEQLMASEALVGTGHLLAGQLALHENRLSDAERHFRTAQEELGDTITIRSALTRMLVLEQRWPEVLAAVGTLLEYWKDLSVDEIAWVKRMLGTYDRVQLIQAAAHLNLDQVASAQAIFNSLRTTPLAPDAALVQADYHFQRSELPPAIQLLSAVRRQFPEDFRLVRYLARAHELNHDVQAAWQSLATFAKDHPSDILAHITLAKWMAAHDQADAAIQWLEQLCVAFPTEGQPPIALAEILMENDRFDQARKVISQLQQSPHMTVVRTVLSCQLALRTHGFEQSVAQLDALPPDLARSGIVQLLRAESFYGEDDLLNAVPNYAFALKFAETQAVAEERMREAFQKVKEEQGATASRNVIDEVISLCPSQPLPLRLAAELAIEQQEWALASSYLKRLRRLEPDSPAADISLARVCVEQQLFSDAADHLTRALRVAHDDLSAHELAATVSYRLGRPQEALSHVDRLIDLGYPTPNLLLAKAKLLALLNRTDEAIELLSQQIGQCPEETALHLELAKTLNAHGMPAQAISLIDQWRQLAPASVQAELLRDKLRALCQLKQWDAAAEAARRSEHGNRSAEDCLVLAHLFLAEQCYGEARFWVAQAKTVSGSADDVQLQLVTASIDLAEGCRERDEDKLRSARAELETLLEKHPQNVVLLNNLAWAYCTQFGQPELALECAERIRRQLAGRDISPHIVDTLATIYLMCNQPERSLEIVESALERHPYESRFHFLEGLSAFERARQQDSSDALQDARASLLRALQLGLDEEQAEQARQILEDHWHVPIVQVDAQKLSTSVRHLCLEISVASIV